MSPSTPPKKQIEFLGGIASILSLLGICLFFSGWIYRWAYYSFFQLELARLDFPPQSFLLVPLQIFLGSPLTILKTAIIVGFIPLLVHLTLGLLRLLENLGKKALSRLPLVKKLWNRISEPNQIVGDSIQFFQSLIGELAIVFWVLLIIFWFARHQGEVDARRDAVNETSTLPVVTLITHQKNMILGTGLAILKGDIPSDPAIADNVILGDVQLAQEIRKQNLNDLSEQRVWRLLTEREGWIFLFPTLSAQSSPQVRPPLLAIPKASSEQLMILSPNVPKEKAAP